MNTTLLDALADDVWLAQDDLRRASAVNEKMPGSVSVTELNQYRRALNGAIEALAREEGGRERLKQMGL